MPVMYLVYTAYAFLHPQTSDEGEALSFVPATE